MNLTFFFWLVCSVRSSLQSQLYNLNICKLYLKSCWTPVYKLYRFLCFDGCNGSVDVLNENYRLSRIQEYRCKLLSWPQTSQIPHFPSLVINTKIAFLEYFHSVSILCVVTLNHLCFTRHLFKNLILMGFASKKEMCTMETLFT